jgi:hypothetical protein
VDEGNHRRIPVATAYAAALTSGIDTCLGSMSGGAQTPVFGISIGSTKHDNTCEIIKLSRELKMQGFGYEACQLLVNEDRRVARAFASTRRFCTTATVEERLVPVVPAAPPVLPPSPPAPIGERG